MKGDLVAKQTSFDGIENSVILVSEALVASHYPSLIS